MFDKCWGDYTDAFKEYWRKLGRADRTRVVNAGVMKDKEGNLVNVVMDKYSMEEQIKKREEGV